PAQHYTMAGIRTNKDGAVYGLKGLFSAGEAACWDMHGFNRLGGNSLAETIVAGKIVGEKVAEFLQGYDVAFDTALTRDALLKQQDRIEALIQCKSGKENVYAVRNDMQNELMDRVGIFRNEKDLQTAVDNLQEIYSRAEQVGLKSNGIGVNPELSLSLKIKGMVKLALCAAYAALQRTESRGCHAREDYEARNDRDWLKRTLATWDEGATLPTLNYEPVSPSFELPPGERGYGTCKIIPCADNDIGD
ncbi:fumarate reductase/succinate dehydrogenase flavoprotein C-terminal domain protein, partial [delta proteobacterium NaphS2]